MAEWLTETSSASKWRCNWSGEVLKWRAQNPCSSMPRRLSTSAAKDMWYFDTCYVQFVKYSQISHCITSCHISAKTGCTTLLNPDSIPVLYTNLVLAQLSCWGCVAAVYGVLTALTFAFFAAGSTVLTRISEMCSEWFNWCWKRFRIPYLHYSLQTNSKMHCYSCGFHKMIKPP